MKHFIYRGKDFAEWIETGDPARRKAPFFRTRLFPSFQPGNMALKVFVWGIAFAFLSILAAPVDIQAQQREDSKELFMWVGAQKLQKEQPATLENMLLFAKRFHIIPYSSGMNDPDKLRGFLSACREHGIDSTWIEIGPGKDITIERFVEDIS